MDHSAVPLELKSLKNLDGEASYKPWIEPLELVLLDELIQVH